MQNISVERFEYLRVVLERQQSREIDYSEAVEVGETLIRFFEVLAEGGLHGKEN